MTESRRDAEREAIERRLRGEAVRVDENNPDAYFVPLSLALDALDAVRSSQGVNIPPLCDQCGGDHYITEHDDHIHKAAMDYRASVDPKTGPTVLKRNDLRSPYEGCSKRGGVCDCGERPCFVDAKPPDSRVSQGE